MTFADELARFRAAYPDADMAEVFMVDLNGIVRGKLMPVEALGKLAKGTMKLPSATASLDIFSHDVPETGLATATGDPDGPMVPVPGSLGPMLWAQRPTAQVQAMTQRPDGSDALYDPRRVLERVVAMARERGLTPVVALEIEFYLIDPREALPPVNPVAGGRLSVGQVFEMDVSRAFAPILAQITDAAAALGAEAEAIVTEFGRGQFEINLHHTDDPLAAADQAVALRRAIRGVARANGLDATFMAKPYGDTVGSGMHAHLSLLGLDGKNLFAGSDDQPNQALRHAIAGCIAHMPDAMLIFAPHLNSYRRFVMNWIAPVEAAWSLDNRDAAIRVPETQGAGARLEHRVAGADANPYLVAAALLASVLAGIDAQAEPPAPFEGGFEKGDGQPLPIEWGVAEQTFAKSAFVEEWLGPVFQHTFGSIKRQEIDLLKRRITDVETEIYLRRI